MRKPQVIRDGTKWCDYHLKWEPVTDFTTFRRQSRDGTVPLLSPRCKLAEQTIRDQERAIDPAASAIKGRAKALARDLSKATGKTVGYQWVMTELHWVGLIPYLRAAIGPGGTCLNCGKHWDEAKEYHLAHHIPAPHLTAWAYQHARNLRPDCGGCNDQQGTTPFASEHLEAEHRKWMEARHWTVYAGTKGWPPYDPSMGEPSTVLTVTGPCDDDGNPTLFAI